MSSFLKRFGLVLLGLLFGLVLAEGAARWVLPPPKRQISLLRMRAPDLQMDAATNLKNPGYNPFIQRRPFGKWVCDGKNPETMNNEGFRDKDFSVEKKPGIKRIAVIGDSFVEGWMGPREVAWPRVLEKILGPQWEVMNFGIANRSPIRYGVLYDQIIRKYHPDQVILCLYENDVREDEFLRPYVTFDDQGIPQSFDYIRYFRNTPRMPQTWMEKHLDKLQWNLCLHSRLYPYAAIYFKDPEFRNRVLGAAPQAPYDALWANTARYLLATRDMVKNDGSRFILTYAPCMGDFNNPDPMFDHAEKFAKANGISFFKAESFLREPHSEILYIPGDGHFSAEGHRRFAMELTEWMRGIKN